MITKDEPVGKLKVETFCLGDWQTNCFVLTDENAETGECWIVDAGFYPAPMLEYIHANDLVPTRVVLTHAHVDHIAGLGALRAVWAELPIYIHAAETDFLAQPTLNLSAALAATAGVVVAPEATGTLAHGDAIALDGVRFQVRHTPGHSPGGISLYDAVSKQAIVGDALFRGSIGRTDFPTSDHEALIEGINRELMTLPDETVIYPGHGPVSTIGDERRGNPYLRG